MPPFENPPGLPGVRWSEPRIVIRAEYAEWTPEGVLRHASYKGLERGRDPLEVHREEAVDVVAARRSASRKAVPPPPAAPRQHRARRSVRRRPIAASPPAPPSDGPPQAATPAELAALDAMGASGAWSVGGHDVSLTNLDKVLFPGPGYTKRDLVRYYASIAPVLLPHLRQRPLNFDRWPDGVTGKHFWQKQIPSHAPDWVARWDYPEAGHDQSHTYVVADRVATMAWLANQAVIDLHPWTSRLPDYWRPTYALIDIDPGERTTWPEVLVLARLFRTALGHLGVTAFPKVTGKRGIQAWIPVEPRYTYDDTRAWVEALSQGHRRDRPGAGQLGVGQGRPRRPGAPRLHPEHAHQDAGGAVRGAAGGQRGRLAAHRLGRAGRPRAAARPLGPALRHPPGRSRGRPLRGCIDAGAEAAGASERPPRRDSWPDLVGGCHSQSHRRRNPQGCTLEPVRVGPPSWP